MINKQALIPRGWSYSKAINMGMPHCEKNRCYICGRQSCEQGFHSMHHITPKGSGSKTMELFGRKMESAQVYLCGSGTTGCHNEFHGGAKYKMFWKWDHPELEKMWFDGTFLGAGVFPHSPNLWQYGRYEITEIKYEAGKRYERVFLEIFNDESVSVNGEWRES